ncbi:hypothetical protein M3Y97_00536700 [Aphelenchoides bicaudatus]|nr:hypothetical protein M3Y97_00536700 [Aphelenchoides bicaudatus]
MKRTAANAEEATSSHDLIVDNDYDDEYVQHGSGRSGYPGASVRTFRQVEYSRLRQPITLPRWARNNYRNMDIPTVPQLAPEIRVLPMGELMVYEDGGEEEHQQIEADPDGQIDVCAIEDTDNVETHENMMDGPTPSKQTRSNSGSAVKVENEPMDAAAAENQLRSERYRILRRTGNENLASRVRRENATLPPVKNDDDLILEYEGVANATGDMVQEEIEVIDQDVQNMSQPFNVMYTPSPLTLNRRATFNDPRSVVNLQELYEEMFRYAPALSIDAFNDIFGTESSMSYPLNVKL